MGARMEGIEKLEGLYEFTRKPETVNDFDQLHFVCRAREMDLFSREELSLVHVAKVGFFSTDGHRLHISRHVPYDLPEGSYRVLRIIKTKVMLWRMYPKPIFDHTILGPMMAEPTAYKLVDHVGSVREAFYGKVVRSMPTMLPYVQYKYFSDISEDMYYAIIQEDKDFVLFMDNPFFKDAIRVAAVMPMRE